MGKEANIILECNRFNQQSCGGRLIEISSTEYAPGNRITFKVHSISQELLDNLYLQQGCRSWGAGTPIYSMQLVNEVIHFQGDIKKQLQYPINYIVRITANTDIVTIDTSENTIACYAPKGAPLTALKKIGHSCVGFDSETQIYGSALISYYKAPYTKYWSWSVPNNTGLYYFFLVQNGKMVHQWTCEVEGIDDYGIMEKDITINVSDYVSNGAVDLVKVYVDTAYKGMTDVDGNINLDGVEVGTHSLKMTKSGYVNSDEDDIANDEFTVT